MKVTENLDNVWSVSAQGGVTALLKICHNDSHCRGELISLACRLLKNLVAIVEIKRFMVEEGAILELIELARSKDEVVQISSLDLLQSMAHKDESVRERIFKEGGIIYPRIGLEGCLLAVWDIRSSQEGDFLITSGSEKGIVKHPFPLNYILKLWKLGRWVYQVIKFGIVQYGPLAFYKSFIPNFGWRGSWNVIMFLTVEQAKKFVAGLEAS